MSHFPKLWFPQSDMMKAKCCLCNGMNYRREIPRWGSSDLLHPFYPSENIIFITCNVSKSGPERGGRYPHLYYSIIYIFPRIYIYIYIFYVYKYTNTYTYMYTHTHSLECVWYHYLSNAVCFNSILIKIAQRKLLMP